MNKLKKGFFKMAGLTLTLTGFAILGVSWYLMANPGVNIDRVKADKFAYEKCSKFGKEYGFTMTKNTKGELTFKKENLADWQAHLATSSVVLEKCSGYEIYSYCLGDECKPRGEKSAISGITFNLIPFSTQILK